MSDTKWTKGKWVIEPVKDFYHVLSADKALPYSVADTIGGLSEEMQKANAHLIAAAPELYEALLACWMRLQTARDIGNAADDYALEKAKAALAKARGEE